VLGSPAPSIIRYRSAGISRTSNRPRRAAYPGTSFFRSTFGAGSVAGIPPLQRTGAEKRQPLGGFVFVGIDVKPHPAGEAPSLQPGAVGLALRADSFGGIRQPGIGRRAVVQRRL